jgi:hypothetical protein
MHPYAVFALYFVHLYLGVEIGLALSAAQARATLSRALSCYLDTRLLGGGGGTSW